MVRVDLRFLYVGSDDVDADLAAWLRWPGSRLRWRFRHFGADVAAVDLGARPLVLVADHRPPGSVLPIYGVGDLEASMTALRGAGWALDLGPVGTPEGPAGVLRSIEGTTVAILQVDRPGAMEAAFADRQNTHRVTG